MRTATGFLAVGVIWACSAALARDICVDNLAGDDRNDGRYPRGSTGMDGPVRTIERALRLAQSGDRVVLAKNAEPYRESISLVGSRRSGLSFRDFVLQGNGAVLDGSAPVPPDAWQYYRDATFRFRPPHLEYQQLFLNDRPAPRVIAGPLAGAPPELQPGQWCLLEGYIYFCVDPTRLPEDYPLSYAQLRVGITLYHVERVTIQDLVVQGFQLDGINAANSARDVTLTGVVCRGNGRSGITVGGASMVDLDACLVGNNGEAQLLTLPYSETHVRNSELLSNTAPAWVDQGGRFFLDGKELHGGLNAIKPAPAATP